MLPEQYIICTHSDLAFDNILHYSGIYDSASASVTFHTFRFRLLSKNLTELIAKWRRVWSQSSSSSEHVTKVPMSLSLGQSAVVAEICSRGFATNWRRADASEAASAVLERPTTAAARSSSDCNSSSDWTSSSVTSVPTCMHRVFAAADVEREREREKERKREKLTEREKERERYGGVCRRRQIEFASSWRLRS